MSPMPGKHHGIRSNHTTVFSSRLRLSGQPKHIRIFTAGTLISVAVAPGDEVQAGQEIAVVEVRILYVF